ncbi:VOC family protein [Halalkalicoccus jeotgali]|uniref:Glyoxalase/bleomycin resistance protein/dioxygenase n=1 Tax=Halalkalicoccus jeotgali (strain DSM 18796 / CECT 7217 / JCM 14584 / KCTC 4019 / B3) TaxID=795797 RepID=D8J4A3_HALJB|nr:VOC family protein [Halalkalicoccus jeotgali]ADJ13465.1 Glyoxalase/bleomycin resistance protein/dioxygenase [Halalkalicoccus jeotgali B3]ELY33060.1 Glyoxalase/bleomycin resistance protein/dioxygenase [Halalkalicoccus jeotgali B3]
MIDSVLPDRTHVGRVALRANNLDRLVVFYRDVLGLTVLEREADRATLGAGDDSLLELLAAPEAPERGTEEAGLFHVAFLVPSRAALGDALSRIHERWHLDGASDHRVSEALYLSDPEGNGIEIYRDRPREEWPTNEGRIEMATLPLDLDALGDRRRGEAGVPDETTVGHVHLEVTDLPRVREFYVEGLGLTVRQEWSDAALFLAAGDYHHHVGLNTWNGRTAPASGRGLAWVELLVPDREALGAVRDRIGRAEQSEGTDTLSLSDPDGIELRVRVEGTC